jgi:hypothetical protein
MAKIRIAIHHKKKQFTLSLAVVAGFAPLAIDVGTQIKNGNFSEAGRVAVHNLAGYNYWSNTWDMDGFKHGLFPILAGFLVHKFIGGNLGINRMLARAGIPIIRL